MYRGMHAPTKDLAEQKFRKTRRKHGEALKAYSDVRRSGEPGGNEVLRNLCPRLLEFEGARIQLIIHSLFGKERIVAAALDDPAVVEDHDDV